MNIQQIAAERAKEKYPIYHDLSDHETEVQDFRRAAYASGFLDCLQYLSWSEGDMEDKFNYSYVSDIRSGCTDADGCCDHNNIEWYQKELVKDVQQLLATHTAKVANREWVCTVDGMPERLPERRTDEDSHCSINVFVSDYCDQVYEAYWDFDKNVWRYYDSDEALYDIIAWINKPFNNQPPKSPTPQD